MDQRPHLSIPGVQSSTDLYQEATADDDVDGCRRFVCCMCCCNRVHKSTRIKIIWALLLITAATSCVILGCLVFRPDTPFVSKSDMRSVTEHVDFLFCEEVGIESDGPHFDAYRVALPLKIDEYMQNDVEFDTGLYLEGTSNDYYSFYFLQKSSFTIQQCSKQPVTFYVIQGEENFKTWQDDNGCEECYLVKQYIQPSLECDMNAPRDEFNLNIHSTDEYFIVYDNEFSDQTWVNVHLKLHRSIYNLDGAELFCSDNTYCSVVLSDRKQVVVYQVESYGSLGQFRHSHFTTKCIPRVWPYLLFHGVFVILFGILSSILVQKMCQNPDTERLLNIQANERTPLLYGTSSPPPYGNVILNPPKYDDVMRYCDPPSYSDVTRDLEAYTHTIIPQSKSSDDEDSDRALAD